MGRTAHKHAILRTITVRGDIYYYAHTMIQLSTHPVSDPAFTDIHHGHKGPDVVLIPDDHPPGPPVAPGIANHQPVSPDGVPVDVAFEAIWHVQGDRELGNAGCGD